jgi:hypothetical protein
MIRLITVIGHGIDLVEHHIKHYLNFVDEINYVVYETDLYPSLANEIKEIVESYINVKIVKIVKDRTFDWGRVTELYNEVKLTKPNDWWVVADIDEFHLYPENSLNLLISDCDKNGWDVVRGGFVDRIGIDGGFPKLLNEINIFKQYPTLSFFRYPLSYACPNKICVCKGYVEVTDGQHYAKINGLVTSKWQGWGHPLIAPIETYSVQVHHFKWDETCIERIKAVADNNKDYSYSKEYELLYEELSKTNFKINLQNDNFEIQITDGQNDYNTYKNWNKLIKKITSI